MNELLTYGSSESIFHSGVLPILATEAIKGIGSTAT